MPSIIQIVNRALDRLGEDHISDLSNNVKAARVMGGLYESVRDAVLRSHPWGFAIKRVSIAADATAPLAMADGYSGRHAKPADCLRVLEVVTAAGYNVRRYSIEEGFILSEATGEIQVRYVAQITDSSRYDSLFCEALSCQLALEGENSIADLSDNERQGIKDDLKRIMMQARNINGQEHSPDDLETESWINERW